ncbi:YadA C-terminal domain-containing protein [Agarivorans sp. 1_MG-2023]|uniref:YadA C-terminal domain-containing protein n=1 Tax=Agarivorans sp. 1_MG-2023 TaxID=3062634 RepID=UPI0026E316AC|nr:YadA C-terminal domain-containing protein [Agarivorans sp. 1_MG-2023]MDO6762599.1 YadA C-terminal domain-containing protein [Agarivorans sp. 1_MG-2023]
MNKSILALTLAASFTFGAQADDYDFDRPGNGTKQDNEIIEASGAIIGAASDNKTVSKYFKAETPEAKKEAAAEYAAAVIENDGKPIGGADEFASKADKDGTQSAHDQLMTEGLSAIRNSDEFKNASDVDAVKLGFQSKSDMRIAIDDTIAEHNENRWGVENAKDANGRIIADDRHDTDGDFGVKAPTKPQPPVKPAPPSRSERNSGNIERNSGSISQNAVGIQKNKQDIMALNEKVERQSEVLKEQMDGVKAMTHATVNARPFALDGEFAMGVGLGQAGNVSAVSLGGSYGISNGWAISGTLSAETGKQYQSNDVSGGVGVQKRW